MANFAKLGLDNVVLEVVFVDNINTMSPQGLEDENVGIKYLQKLTGHMSWKQTSYNRSFRKHFAGKNYIYNTQLDAFCPPKPFASWTLDETNCEWVPPIAYPVDDETRMNYRWDEETQTWVEN